MAKEKVNYQEVYDLYQLCCETKDLREFCTDYGVNYDKFMMQLVSGATLFLRDWTLGSLHLTGFCRAVMYVLKEKLGLEDRYLLMEPDAKLGVFLFNEIMATWNFGFHDSRYYDSKSFMDKYRIKRKFFMIWRFPYDLMWYPYWKIEKLLK